MENIPKPKPKNKKQANKRKSKDKNIGLITTDDMNQAIGILIKVYCTSYMKFF